MPTSKHFLFAAMGLVAMLALGVVVFVVPTYRQAATVRERIGDLRARIANLEHSTQDVERLTAEVAQQRLRIEREFKIIPESADIASLIRKLSLPVDQTMVRDQTFTAGSPGDAIPGGASPLQAIPLMVDMEATFDSVFALVRSAESVDRLVRVSSVRMMCKRDEAQNDRPILKATVSLDAIFEPPRNMKEQ